jgi:hypothetical protein
MKKSILCQAVPIALAISLALGLGSTAQAQESGTNHSPTAEQNAEPLAFDQNELKSFAKATIQVENISKKWLVQIAEAEDPTKQREMRQKANEELVQAVEGEKISIEKYNTILQTIKRSPDLRAKVEKLREEVK